ncbi:LysR substrate-binding domain-containing protein [Hyalangium rubrum]|uniref:LysR substrate-binding domain-containing protein n=1 Tax=Hyalangium rubrum TaxID=3103134 RepID=A0ABU5HG78_9BACT|nr:LysR substrate-binding domain-containing protein [Hyalangium sp. s54d21]MDY7232149.1 LysR substrate-binding domain-containing protein [Hyalangium sp. s54d21]
MKRPGLFELQAISAVASHRSFRAASAELGLSPSALSHAVAALEKRLGVRLFQRTTRSVSLTEAGDRFLSRVRPALAELSAAMESVNAFRDTPTGTLRITTSEGAARQVFTPIVLEFMKRYPDMKVELVVESRFVDIVKEGFDAGIRLLEAVPQEMVAVPCGPRQRSAVVGSPRYFKANRRPMVPADLRAHRCIRLRKRNGGLYAWEFERRGEELAIEVDGPLTLDTLSLVIEAALNGAGLAYLNEWDVRAYLASGKLVSVLEDWLPAWPGLCVFYPSQRHVPAGLRAFVEVVKEVTKRDASR